MKKRLLAIFAVIALFSVFLVACNNGDKPNNDNDKEKEPTITPPQEVTLTYDEFSEKAETFKDIQNYLMNSTGYLYDLTYKRTPSTSEEAKVDLKSSGVLDISDYEDVKVSVYFNVTSTAPKTEIPKVPSGVSGTVPAANNDLVETKLEGNVYLYTGTLYADYKKDGGEVKKDSVTGINNNLAVQLNSLLTSGSVEEAFGDMFGGFNDMFGGLFEEEGSETPEAQPDDYLEHFKPYMTITYNETFGHYKIVIDYPEVAEPDEELKDVPPFVSTIDLYVKNDRVTETVIDYNDGENQLKVTIDEKKATDTIEYPDDPSTYDGDFLDMLQKTVDGKYLTAADYYGKWISLDGTSLNISAEGVQIDDGGDDIVTLPILYQYSIYLVCGNDNAPSVFVLMDDKVLMLIDPLTGVPTIFAKIELPLN